ncbi:MAG: glycosyltransferase family 4 protein [Muribaculaceae bacterium]|nr:glycosyltransferase family 4 protein [Muribaculaceae bacterium]
MKIVRASTIPLSLNVFCRGLLSRLAAEYDVLAVSSPGPDLDEVAEREGVRTVAVPMERHIAPPADLRSLWRIWRLFRREKPAMVHSLTPKAGLLCMLAGKLAGVPVRVHTFTGLVFPTSRGLKRKLLMLTDRITCACATHIVPEGRGVMDDLRQYGITRRPMRILGHGNIRGIDLEHYRRTPEIERQAASLRQELGVKEDDVVLVFVGRLVADKGVAELIKAFESIDDPKLHLLLVGPPEPDVDPLDAGTLRIIATHPRIHAVGPQPDVRPYLAAADVSVLPSYREGFPNVVIESGALELPCIVTDINGSREIIEHGRNGLIVPPRDADALRDAIAMLSHDAPMRHRLAAEARPMVASRFEQGYVWKCLTDFYHEILPPQ